MLRRKPTVRVHGGMVLTFRSASTARFYAGRQQGLHRRLVRPGHARDDRTCGCADGYAVKIEANTLAHLVHSFF